MKAIWILGGEKRVRLHVEAKAATIAVSSAEVPSNPTFFPIIAVTYPFEEYALVVKIANEMKLQGAAPRVYLWNMERLEPEVVVWFGIEKPTPAFLERLGVQPLDTLTCEVVFTFAEANAFREQVGTFMKLFRELGFFLVAVAEEEPVETNLLQPTVQFLVEEIVHNKPTIETL